MRRDIIIATILEKLEGKYYKSNDAYTVIQEELGNNFQIYKDVDLVDEIHQLWEETSEVPIIQPLVTINEYRILYN
jgi:hypothetical protein